MCLQLLVWRCVELMLSSKKIQSEFNGLHSVGCAVEGLEKGLW